MSIVTYCVWKVQLTYYIGALFSHKVVQNIRGIMQIHGIATENSANFILLPNINLSDLPLLECHLCFAEQVIIIVFLSIFSIISKVFTHIYIT